MRNKQNLSYITIAAIFVLTSIFIGVHMTGVKDSSAHTQLIINQKQSPKYSEISLGRDRGKIAQVIRVLTSDIDKDIQRHLSLVAEQRDLGLLSVVSPRGPPNLYH